MPRIPKRFIKSVSRNYTLIKGVERYGRGAMFHKKGTWVKRHPKLWKKVPKGTPNPNAKYDERQSKKRRIVPKGAKKKEEISQEKKSDVPVPEGTKPAEGTKSTPTQPAQRKQKKLPRAFNERKLTGRKKKHERKLNPPHLRKSITPGTVLILLTGRFKGRRVVFLKQLESGLLLVTGPYKLNGIPLRRVNQAYVIATSTKVPLTFKIPKTFDDTYFRKPITKKTKAEDKPKDDFSPQKKKKKHVLPGKVKNVQKKFDAPILAEIKKTPFLKAYLQTRFSLHDKEFPHLLRF